MNEFCLPAIREVQGNTDPVQVDLDYLKQIVKKPNKIKQVRTNIGLADTLIPSSFVRNLNKIFQR